MDSSIGFITNQFPISFYVCAGLAAVAIGALWVFFKWLESRCPKCGKGWKIETSRTKINNDTVDTKYEKRNSGSVDGNGQAIQVTVPVVYVTSEYLVHWECSGCGHRWNGTEKRLLKTVSGAWGKAPGERGVPRITEGSRGQGEGLPPQNNFIYPLSLLRNS